MQKVMNHCLRRPYHIIGWCFLLSCENLGPSYRSIINFAIFYKLQNRFVEVFFQTDVTHGNVT